jgi:hypothetical protein
MHWVFAAVGVTLIVTGVVGAIGPSHMYINEWVALLISGALAAMFGRAIRYIFSGE